jgi:hypothetical protein
LDTKKKRRRRKRKKIKIYYPENNSGIENSHKIKKLEYILDKKLLDYNLSKKGGNKTRKNKRTKKYKNKL